MWRNSSRQNIGNGLRQTPYRKEGRACINTAWTYRTEKDSKREIRIIKKNLYFCSFNNEKEENRYFGLRFFFHFRDKTVKFDSKTCDITHWDLYFSVS